MKAITTTLLTAALLTTSQIALAASPFNLPTFTPPVGNIPIINPNHLEQLNKPDLAILIFAAADRPRVMPDNSIQVRVGVSVRNEGRRPAGKFKLAVTSTHRGRTSVVPFKTASRSTGYPMVQAGLRPQVQSVTSGHLIFRSSERGKTVFVKIKADSCRGERLTHSYCRVDETNENNNTSPFVRIRLP